MAVGKKSPGVELQAASAAVATKIATPIARPARRDRVRVCEIRRTASTAPTMHPPPNDPPDIGWLNSGLARYYVQSVDRNGRRLSPAEQDRYEQQGEERYFASRRGREQAAPK